MALKDWPKHWYQGCNKARFAQKRGDRERIVREYLEVYSGDDAKFKEAYPMWKEGHSKLKDAIDQARTARGERKERKRRRMT